SFGTSLHRQGGLADCGHDPRVGPAAADVAVHGPHDLGRARLGLLVEQADPRHDHPRGAVAALHGPSVEERLLERVEAALALEALDGRDRLLGHGADACGARARRLAVDEHGARSAAPLAAAVLRARQVELIAEYAEQAPLGVDVDAPD